MPEPIVTEATAADEGSNAELEITDAALDTVDDAQTTDQGDESTVDNTAEPEAEGDEPKTGIVDPAQNKEDGRVIPQWIRDLKEKNPEGYKKAKAELFELRDRRSVHATPQAAREEHDIVQSLGGPEGITRIREDVSFLHDAQSQFAKGDPQFTEDLWKEDAIAAALHVAPMMEQYAKHDPEGYKATVARQWDNEFTAVGFGRGLDNLLAAIEKGDKASSVEIAKSIQGWYQSIANVAKQAEDPRVKTLLAERAKRQETAQQTEQTEFMTSYRTEAVNQVVAEGAKVFDSFFKNHKLDKTDRDDLLREVLAASNRAVMADKEFGTQRDKHLGRKDSHAALSLTKARYAREFPEAVKRVMRRYGMVSGAKPNGQQKPAQQQGKPVVAAPAGYVRVNTRPQAEDIDRGRTTNDMIISGKAILHGGKKVDWSHLKKAANA